MKNRLKTAAVAVCMAMAMAGSIVPVYADEVVSTANENTDYYAYLQTNPVYHFGQFAGGCWTINSDGTLYLWGTMSLPDDYAAETDAGFTDGPKSMYFTAPWRQYVNEITKVSCKGLKVVGKADYLFAEMNRVTSIDLTGCDFSATTSLRGAFCSDESLTTIDGLAGLQTEKVTDFDYLFMGDLKLTEADLSTWDFSSMQSAMHAYTMSGIVHPTFMGVLPTAASRGIDAAAD